MKIMLDPGATMPTKAHPYDAGWDLYAKEDFTVPPSKADGISFGMMVSGDVAVGSAIHDTGVHIEIPNGYVGFIKSKSGLNVKYGLTADGVIDSGYTGSVIVKLYNHTSKTYHFEKGDKITQLVILPCFHDNLELVETLEETERGANGFGSSGK